MYANQSATDDTPGSIQGNLITMSDSVGLISSSLVEYEKMINQSKSSMDDLILILTDIQNNLAPILNGVVIVLNLFFFW